MVSFDVCKSCYYWSYMNEGILSLLFFITDMLLLVLEHYRGTIAVQETMHIDIEFYEF